MDHHHAIDQNRTATKVRFTEPAEEKDEFNDDDAKVITVLAFCICATSWLIENWNYNYFVVLYTHAK